LSSVATASRRSTVWIQREVGAFGEANARSEAANLTCKNLKRTGRGYRDQGNYQARIMLHSAAETAA
jgi:transposase